MAVGQRGSASVFLYIEEVSIDVSLDVIREAASVASSSQVVEEEEGESAGLNRSRSVLLVLNLGVGWDVHIYVSNKSCLSRSDEVRDGLDELGWPENERKEEKRRRDDGQRVHRRLKRGGGIDPLLSMDPVTSIDLFQFLHQRNQSMEARVSEVEPEQRKRKSRERTIFGKKLSAAGMLCRLMYFDLEPLMNRVGPSQWICPGCSRN